MDELSLLEAVTSDEVAAAEAEVAPVTALSPVQRPDFTGSLDYIDSLASRSALAVSQRDIFNIATGVYLSSPKTLDQEPVLGESFDSISSADFRPLGDARRFHPEGFDRPLVSSSRSASDLVVSPRVISEFPPHFRNPLDPGRDVGDLNRAMRDAERRVRRNPFSFREPDRLAICLKRKIRRGVMASLNFPYRPWPFARRRSNAFSRVIC